MCFVYTKIMFTIRKYSNDDELILPGDSAPENRDTTSLILCLLRVTSPIFPLLAELAGVICAVQ